MKYIENMLPFLGGFEKAHLMSITREKREDVHQKMEEEVVYGGFFPPSSSFAVMYFFPRLLCSMVKRKKKKKKKKKMVKVNIFFSDVKRCYIL